MTQINLDSNLAYVHQKNIKVTLNNFFNSRSSIWLQRWFHNIWCFNDTSVWVGHSNFNPSIRVDSSRFNIRVRINSSSSCCIFDWSSCLRRICIWRRKHAANHRSGFWCSNISCSSFWNSGSDCSGFWSSGNGYSGFWSSSSGYPIFRFCIRIVSGCPGSNNHDCCSTSSFWSFIRIKHCCCFNNLILGIRFTWRIVIWRP